MPEIPFQLLTIVRLVNPAVPAPDSPEDETIQAAHIRYLGSLVEQGLILANGPVRRRDDQTLRGMSLYTVGPEEARALALQDPGVKAGWFDLIIDQWMIPVRPKTIADRTDLVIDLPD
ncbi:MAG: YciI family protein [Fimbriimonadaceae bacterium]|nr:YciI family protein [Fimbriimonadaceae bacterium]